MLTVGNIAREGSRTRESQGQIAELDYTRDTQEETANSLYVLAVLWI